MERFNEIMILIFISLLKLLPLRYTLPINSFTYSHFFNIKYGMDPSQNIY